MPTDNNEPETAVDRHKRQLREKRAAFLVNVQQARVELRKHVLAALSDVELIYVRVHGGWENRLLSLEGAWQENVVLCVVYGDEFKNRIVVRLVKHPLRAGDATAYEVQHLANDSGVEVVDDTDEVICAVLDILIPLEEVKTEPGVES